jgi:hypothetical protein
MPVYSFNVCGLWFVPFNGMESLVPFVVLVKAGKNKTTQ